MYFFYLNKNAIFFLKKSGIKKIKISENKNKKLKLIRVMIIIYYNKINKHKPIFNFKICKLKIKLFIVSYLIKIYEHLYHQLV
jgi:hypothetical protein